MDMIELPDAGYAAVPGVFQYSRGVRAQPGYAIERVRFLRPQPLARGFDRIAEYLRGIGRPLTAFCACELRSPAQFSEQGFHDFNLHYVATLRAWGVLAAGGNPVARSNVCPEIDPPSEPSFYAFCYAAPASGAAPSFVAAGSGEVREGATNYRDFIVAPGDTSAAGMRAKAASVMAEIERRMALLGGAWPQATGVQVYTVHDIHPLLADLLVSRGAAAHGVTWHYARPPIVGLDYEMDCRSVMTERVIG